MSHDASRAVRAHRFGSTHRKAIMYVLADHASNADWSCFVGQETLAAEAEVGERTVRKILAELEAEGTLRREKRYGGLKGRTSDRIILVRIAIENLPAAGAARSRDLPAPRADLPASGADLPAPHDRSTGTSYAGEAQEKRKEEAPEEGARPCPDCDTGHLIEKTGSRGPFLSCDRYPDCRHSEDLPRPVSTWRPSAADIEEMRRAHGGVLPDWMEAA